MCLLASSTHALALPHARTRTHTHAHTHTHTHTRAALVVCDRRPAAPGHADAIGVAVAQRRLRKRVAARCAKVVVQQGPCLVGLWQTHAAAGGTGGWAAAAEAANDGRACPSRGGCTHSDGLLRGGRALKHAAHDTRTGPKRRMDAPSKLYGWCRPQAMRMPMAPCACGSPSSAARRNSSSDSLWLTSTPTPRCAEAGSRCGFEGAERQAGGTWCALASGSTDAWGCHRAATQHARTHRHRHTPTHTDTHTW
jgi:hypothetical protein